MIELSKLIHPSYQEYIVIIIFSSLTSSATLDSAQLDVAATEYILKDVWNEQWVETETVMSW